MQKQTSKEPKKCLSYNMLVNHIKAADFPRPKRKEKSKEKKGGNAGIEIHGISYDNKRISLNCTKGR